MSIGTVQVHNYRTEFGNNMTEHNIISDLMTQIIRRELTSLTIDKIEVYRLDGDAQDFGAGRSGRKLNFYFNSTFKGAHEGVTDENGLVINGEQTRFTHTLGVIGNEEHVVISSQEGIALAEYNPRKEEINILFDLFRINSPADVELFTYIMKEFERLVWHPKTLENSWIHTQNKEGLVSRFKDRIREQVQRELEDDKYHLQNNEQAIENRKREIKAYWDNVLRLRRQIEAHESNMENVEKKFIGDLDLVVQHEKVKDLQIIDGVFHIWTEPLYMYDDKGNRYFLGSMKIVMNMSNTDVRFYNLDNPRHGYWTNEDPHPHVSGGNNTACLGNVASTIAELCSRNEVYALALMCIDFLENANTTDPAGAKVVNWDEVDEEGNIIRSGEEGDEENEFCDCCQSYHREEDMFGVAYGAVNDDGEVCDEAYICNDCRDDNYYYSEILGETVHCEVDDELYADNEEEEEDEL